MTLDDGTWCLVRASSNKPSLVVVESPTSEANMRAIFQDLDGRLSKHPEVGEYDQKIWIFALPLREGRIAKQFGEGSRRSALVVPPRNFSSR